MVTPKRMFAVMSLLVIASMLITACGPSGATTPVVIKETVVVNGTPIVVTAPPPTSGPAEPTATASPKTLVVCMAQEPQTLYTLSEAALVKSAVLEAVYDFGVDTRTYGYQPVGITKLPDFKDGDAKKNEVTLKAGDKVYDAATDEVVTLPVTHEVTINQVEGDPVVLAAGATEGKAVQLEVSWTLVDGLMWEDGTPVTADDLVFAWDTAASPDSPNSKYTIERSLSFEKVDDKTVKWTSLPGYTTGTYFLDALYTPLPKHLYDGKLTPAQMLKDEQVNRKPLAFGPFKIQEWVSGDHLTLVKNSTYYRAKEGLPKVDTLIFRFVPDTNQLIAQLVSGECDLGTQDAAFEGSLPLIKQFESQGLLKPQIVAGTVFEHLDFNAQPVDSYAGFAGSVKNEDGTPIFANPEIRQAIAYCLDRQAIIDGATNGAAVAQDVYTPAEHPLFAGTANLTVYPFDAAKGLELLKKNGWTDTDADGVLDNGKGQKFEFVHSTRTNPLRQKVTQIVQEQLAKNCMISTTIELVGGEFFSDGPDGMVFGRKFDMGEFAWLTGVEPPCDLYTTNHIPNEENGWGASNDTGFSNPDFDKACTAGINTLDENEKKTQHALAQKIFSEQLPSIILFARAKILVTRPEVTGVEMDPTANSEMWNVENFDITPQQ
jgi:peptide/nickel transport system substrate-binding protein